MQISDPEKGRKLHPHVEINILTKETQDKLKHKGLQTVQGLSCVLASKASGVLETILRKKLFIPSSIVTKNHFCELCLSCSQPGVSSRKSGEEF